MDNGRLFALFRRYTLAVIAAAKSTANIAVLTKTNAPACGEAAKIEPMTEMEFVRNMVVRTHFSGMSFIALVGPAWAWAPGLL